MANVSEKLGQVLEFKLVGSSWPVDFQPFASLEAENDEHQRACRLFQRMDREVSLMKFIRLKIRTESQKS